MPTTRKLRWASNFFIWSAIIALVLQAFPAFDQWSRKHAAQPSSLEALADFVGYMIGGLVIIGGPFILALVNGLVLRRYQSRIAAALFTIFGLLEFGVALFVLLYIGFDSTAVAMVVFYGAYFAIAAWTFVTLMLLHSRRKVAVPFHTSAARRILHFEVPEPCRRRSNPAASGGNADVPARKADQRSCPSSLPSPRAAEGREEDL